MDQHGQEQVLLLKDWYQRYGSKLLTIVIILLAIYVAYQYFERKKQTNLQQASHIYNELLKVVSVGLDNKAQQEKFDQFYGFLSGDYANTVYADLAGLVRAKIDVQNQDYTEAESTLNFILNSTSSDLVKELAALRLARVLAVNDKVDEAIKLVSMPSQLFSLEYQVALGDFYLMQDLPEKALAAYTAAQSSSTDQDPLLQMKIARLSQDPEKIIQLKQ